VHTIAASGTQVTSKNEYSLDRKCLAATEPTIRTTSCLPVTLHTLSRHTNSCKVACFADSLARWGLQGRTISPPHVYWGQVCPAQTAPPGVENDKLGHTGLERGAQEPTLNVCAFEVCVVCCCLQPVALISSAQVSTIRKQLCIDIPAE
jgi:hypothetical protein